MVVANGLNEVVSTQDIRNLLYLRASTLDKHNDKQPKKKRLRNVLFSCQHLDSDLDTTNDNRFSSR